MALELQSWWRRIGGAVGRALLDLVFPPRCLVCGAEGPNMPDGLWLCRKCREALFPAGPPLCARCAAPIRSGREAVAPCPFVGACPGA